MNNKFKVTIKKLAVKCTENPAFWAIVYFALCLPTYLLPWIQNFAGLAQLSQLGAASQGNSQGAMALGVFGIFLKSIFFLLMLGLTFLAHVRGKITNRNFLKFFVIGAVIFEYVPFINMIPMVPSLFHTLAFGFGLLSKTGDTVFSTNDFIYENSQEAEPDEEKEEEENVELPEERSRKQLKEQTIKQSEEHSLEAHDIEPLEDRSKKRNKKYSENQESIENEDENPRGDEQKKLFTMIIRASVVIGLSYLAFDHFVLSKKTDDEIVIIPTKSRKHRVNPTEIENVSKIKKIEIKVIEQNDAKIDTLDTENEIIVSDIKISKEEELRPVEINKLETTDTKKEENIVPLENVKIAEKVSEETKFALNKVNASNDTALIKQSNVTIPQVGEVKSKQIEKDPTRALGSVSEKDITREEESVRQETKLEDKIVENDIHTNPPTYDQEGRGLVYNCKDKHWACVDKPSYVSCSKNMKWNKIHEQAAECAILNVYLSNEDCATVQDHNVSTNQPTPFCQ